MSLRSCGHISKVSTLICSIIPAPRRDLPAMTLLECLRSEVSIPSIDYLRANRPDTLEYVAITVSSLLLSAWVHIPVSNKLRLGSETNIPSV